MLPIGLILCFGEEIRQSCLSSCAVDLSQDSVIASRKTFGLQHSLWCKVVSSWQALDSLNLSSLVVDFWLYFLVKALCRFLRSTRHLKWYFPPIAIRSPTDIFASRLVSPNSVAICRTFLSESRVSKTCSFELFWPCAQNKHFSTSNDCRFLPSYHKSVLLLASARFLFNRTSTFESLNFNCCSVKALYFYWCKATLWDSIICVAIV